MQVQVPKEPIVVTVFLPGCVARMPSMQPVTLPRPSVSGTRSWYYDYAEVASIIAFGRATCHAAPRLVMVKYAQP